MSIFVESTVPADGLALVNAGTSANKQTNKKLLNHQVKLVDTNNHSLYKFYWKKLNQHVFD